VVGQDREPIRQSAAMSYVSCIEISGSCAPGSSMWWGASGALPSDDQVAAGSRVERTLWLVRLLILGASRLDDNAAISRPAGGAYVAASWWQIPTIAALEASFSSPETPCLLIAWGLLSSYSKAGESESAVLGGLLRDLLGGD